MADLPVVVALYKDDIRLVAEPFCPGVLAPIACEKKMVHRQHVSNNYRMIT